GAVTAALDRNRAKARMVAKLLAGIGAEPAAARSLRHLLGDQRHCAVEPDVKDLVAGFERGVGLVMFDEGTKTPDARRDRQTALRMLADLARQRQQLQCAFELNV